MQLLHDIVKDSNQRLQDTLHDLVACVPHRCQRSAARRAAHREPLTSRIAPIPLGCGCRTRGQRRGDAPLPSSCQHRLTGSTTSLPLTAWAMRVVRLGDWFSCTTTTAHVVSHAYSPHTALPPPPSPCQPLTLSDVVIDRGLNPLWPGVTPRSHPAFKC